MNLRSFKTLVLLGLVPIVMLLVWLRLRQPGAHPSASATGSSRSRVSGTTLLPSWLGGADKTTQPAAPVVPDKQAQASVRPATPSPPSLGTLPPQVFFRALPRFQFENTNAVDRCLLELGSRGMRMPHPQLLTFTKVDPGPKDDPKEMLYRVTQVKSLPGPGGPQSEGPAIERPASAPPGFAQPIIRPLDCAQRLLQTTIRMPASAADRPTEFSAVIPILLPAPAGVPGGPPHPGEQRVLAGKGMRAP